MVKKHPDVVEQGKKVDMRFEKLISHYYNSVY